MSKRARQKNTREWRLSAESGRAVGRPAAPTPSSAHAQGQWMRPEAEAAPHCRPIGQWAHLAGAARALAPAHRINVSQLARILQPTWPLAHHVALLTDCGRKRPAPPPRQDLDECAPQPGWPLVGPHGPEVVKGRARLGARPLRLARPLIGAQDAARIVAGRVGGAQFIWARGLVAAARAKSGRTVSRRLGGAGCVARASSPDKQVALPAARMKNSPREHRY